MRNEHIFRLAHKLAIQIDVGEGVYSAEVQNGALPRFKLGSGKFARVFPLVGLVFQKLENVVANRGVFNKPRTEHVDFGIPGDDRINCGNVFECREFFKRGFFAVGLLCKRKRPRADGIYFAATPIFFAASFAESDESAD